MIEINLTIAPGLYTKNEKINLAYASKHSSNHEKQIIFNGSKQRRMGLYCSKKAISIFKE